MPFTLPSKRVSFLFEQRSKRCRFIDSIWTKFGSPVFVAEKVHVTRLICIVFPKDSKIGYAMDDGISLAHVFLWG